MSAKKPLCPGRHVIGDGSRCHVFMSTCVSERTVPVVKDFLGYVFVDEMGNLYKPDMVSETFQKLLNKHGLRKIRFHDIRHSCASLLLKNGVNLKLIQEWLGHSDISTTMNIYAHLDTTAKDVSAAAMSQALSLPEYNGGYGWQRN